MPESMNKRRAARAAAGLRSGFTLTELIVAIAIVALLVTVLVVVTSGAVRSGRDAQTASLLRTIGQGIAVFEQDHGFAPPLVLRNDDGGNPANTILTPTLIELADDLTPREVRERLREERYMSEYTIAVYLLGIGRLSDSVADANPNDLGIDPNGTNGFDGVAGFGFKSPGETRAWVDPRALTQSNSVELQPTALGRTYGPYLDPGSIEDALDIDTERGLHRLLDPNDQPIRYYAGWPVNDPDDPGNRSRVSMAGVPPELLGQDGVESFEQQFASSGAAGNGAISAAYGSWSNPVGMQSLTGSRYALLSAGADGEFGDSVDNDAVGFTSEGLVDIPPLEDDRRRRLFLDQIRDNVRFTP